MFILSVAPPALPPKDVNQFLNDLDYAIPSEIMAAEATKPSPRKVMKPPKNEPVDPAQLIVQVKFGDYEWVEINSSYFFFNINYLQGG